MKVDAKRCNGAAKKRSDTCLWGRQGQGERRADEEETCVLSKTLATSFSFHTDSFSAKLGVPVGNNVFNSCTDEIELNLMPAKERLQ